MLIPGLKGLTPQTSFEFNQCLPVHEASHQPHDWTTENFSYKVKNLNLWKIFKKVYNIALNSNILTSTSPGIIPGDVDVSIWCL